jgi:hypothetical protein
MIFIDRMLDGMILKPLETVIGNETKKNAGQSVFLIGDLVKLAGYAEVFFDYRYIVEVNNAVFVQIELAIKQG